jgi:hypothetical protein
MPRAADPSNKEVFEKLVIPDGLRYIDTSDIEAIWKFTSQWTDEV